MGYTKLTYDEYMENMDYWYGELGVELPNWAKELAERGFQSVCAIDFYDDLFGEDLEPERLPEDYRAGEYAAIAIELVPDGLDKHGKPKYKGQRTTVTQGQSELYELIDRSDNFCMISALSYAGRRRTNKNARYLYALVIEIDDIKPKNGIDELIYSWTRKNLTMPQPTYIVCSGNGLHLYFVFERPIPLYSHIFEQFSAAKTHLTRQFWNSYVTSAHERVQYESVNQPFRCVGSMGKGGSRCAMAFQTGKKLTIEDLNKRLPADLRIDVIYKSKISLEAAKERYPEWYQRRIVEKKARGHWIRHPGIYYNWIKKIYYGAVVGKRYNCLENLCSLAAQCEIEPEQVEKDCRDLAEYLERLTVKDDNHFTEYDVLCALKTYHERKEGAYRRRIEYVANRTGIPLKANKRNGRKQEDHLRRARAVQAVDYPDGEWRKGNGRPSVDQKVAAYRFEHPEASVTEVARALRISRPTVYKWWDAELEPEYEVDEEPEEFFDNDFGDLSAELDALADMLSKAENEECH